MFYLILITLLIVVINLRLFYGNLSLFLLSNLFSLILLSAPKCIYFLSPTVFVVYIFYKKFTTETDLRKPTITLIFCGFLLALIGVILQTFILPYFEQWQIQDKILNYLLGQPSELPLFITEHRNLIFIDPNIIVRASSISSDLTLNDLTFLEFDHNSNLRSFGISDHGIYSSGNTWHLENISQILIDNDGNHEFIYSAKALWTTLITPEHLSGIMNVFGSIELSNNNLDAQIAHYRKALLLPITLAILPFLCAKITKIQIGNFKRIFYLVVLVVLSIEIVRQFNRQLFVFDDQSMIASLGFVLLQFIFIVSMSLLSGSWLYALLFGKMKGQP